MVWRIISRYSQGDSEQLSHPSTSRRRLRVDARYPRGSDCKCSIAFHSSLSEATDQVSVKQQHSQPGMNAHLIYEDARLSIEMSQCPTTSGHTAVTLKQSSASLFSMPLGEFIQILQVIRKVSASLGTFYNVRRCALVTEGSSSLSILPLHGLSEQWKPVTSDTKEFHETYPGYITSKDGPQMESGKLQSICDNIQGISRISEPLNYRFYGDQSDSNLFARLVRGEIPQYRIWENNAHIAFLTPFANMPGFTVVVPRRHLSSDIFSLDEGSYSELLSAAWTVAGILRKAFGVERCGMIFEGFEIDYAHVKLIPIRDVSGVSNEKTGLLETEDEYQEAYQGYVTSLNGPAKKDLDELASDAAAIRELVQSNE